MKLVEILETVAIFLAIFSLWPPVLHWQHFGWKVFMYLMLAVMVLVFVRRWRRYRRLVDDKDSRTDERREC